MSEKMTPIFFGSLMNWAIHEYVESGKIFGVHKEYRASGKSLPIFGERIETPFGPAAGPNSQLAQNIIAAYFAGARFFELKTVQKMDGEDLAACVPDFVPYLGGCRFNDCIHENEPGCSIKEAVAEGKICRVRYENYLQVLEMIRQRKEKYL